MGDRLRIVYSGTLWNLTSVEPLVEAVRQLCRYRPELVPNLELVFVGRKMSHQLALLEQLAETGCHLELRDYCEHSEVLSLMASADILCLLLSDVDGAERVAPAKLFEYLAAHKEILAIAPHGETAEIVTTYFPHNHFTGDDIDGICRWIAERIERKGKVLPLPAIDHDIARFSRQHQAGQLADYFDTVISRVRAPADSGRRRNRG